MSQQIQTIDLDQLALVSGGEGEAGRFERIGRTVGEGAGRFVGRFAPPLVQPVLPPLGRELGGRAGRAVDQALQMPFGPIVGRQ